MSDYSQHAPQVCFVSQIALFPKYKIMQNYILVLIGGDGEIKLKLMEMLQVMKVKTSICALENESIVWQSLRRGHKEILAHQIIVICCRSGRRAYGLETTKTASRVAEKCVWRIGITTRDVERE